MNFFSYAGAVPGLIFTRSWEGKQPGRLNQTGQTGQGIQYHVPSCQVPVGELAWGEGSRNLWMRGALGGESCSVHFAVCFVYSPYQYYCRYCSLRLLFCYTALILIHEFYAIFFPFSSPPIMVCVARFW